MAYYIKSISKIWVFFNIKKSVDQIFFYRDHQRESFESIEKKDDQKKILFRGTLIRFNHQFCVWDYLLDEYCKERSYNKYFGQSRTTKKNIKRST